jgi:hypothetical protein
MKWAGERFLWMDKVVKLSERTAMIHNHASIFCTICGTDQQALKELRAALAEGGKEDGRMGKL